MIWSLPPCINIIFRSSHISVDPHHHWEFGQRLYDNSGTTWRFKKTTWELWKREFTFDVWSNSILRDFGWEFSMATFGYNQDDRLISIGETKTRYATGVTQQWPPWIELNEITGVPVGHPYLTTLASIFPSSLANMWSEVPRWLPDRAEPWSTPP